MKHFSTLIFAIIICIATASGFDHIHEKWNAVIGDHVARGRVAYKAVASDSRFKAYLAELAAVSAVELAKWTPDQQKAYWINAYNAYTVKAILDHYPIKRTTFKGHLYPTNSIRQIPGVWDSLTFMAGGKKRTLNDIEHGILRKDFKEPRVHVALVCASVGCPNLPNYAFIATKLDEQLAIASKAFAANPRQVRIDLTNNTLHLSKILDWYGGDFTGIRGVSNYGKFNGPVSFVVNHLPAAKAKIIKSNNLEVEWIAYDWSLNE